MTDEEQTLAFLNELDCLIARYANEFDLSLPTIIGCLEMIKLDVYKQNNNEDDDN